MKELNQTYPIEFYIHTWNVQSSSTSWRHVEQNNEPVTEERIHNYFRDLSKFIKHIIIDDDSKVELIGKTDGLIARSLAPLKGWKYYWYGKYKICEFLFNNIDPNVKPVVSMRFDVFGNSVGFSSDQILNFIAKYKDHNFKTNAFVTEGSYIGCDNLYMGSISTMYHLTKQFHYDMDRILDANQHIGNQELLAPIINQLISLPKQN